MDVEILSTITNVDLQRMICSVMLETALAAQKSLLSLLFMIELLCLYPDLVGVERRFPFGELKGATVPDNEPKDSSDTDEYENTDDEEDDDEDEDEEESDDDDDKESDEDDARANGGGDDDSHDEHDDEDDNEDDDEEEEEDDDDEEEEDNQPLYKRTK
ncbi:phosphopantothenoylcysteine decarboxylase subunit VHS3 [Capsicum galapagoense]